MFQCKLQNLYSFYEMKKVSGYSREQLSFGYQRWPLKECRLVSRWKGCSQLSSAKYKEKILPLYI